MSSINSSLNIEQPPSPSTLSWLAAQLWRTFLLIRLSLSICLVVLVRKLGLSNLLAALLHTIAQRGFKASGDYFHAEAAYRLILRVNPDDRSATIQLAELYTHFGILEKSAHVLNDWLARFPNDMEAHVIISKRYSQMNEIVKAQEHLDISSRSAPNSADVLEAFGFFHRWNGNLDDSSGFFRAVLKKRERPRILLSLAQNLIDEGDKEEAFRLLERALQLNRDFSGSYGLLASCGHYSDLSHPHIVYMKNRLNNRDVDPINRVGFHFALGKSYDRLSLWDAAFAHFKAGNDLSWCWLKPLFSIEEYTNHTDQEIKNFDSEFLKANQDSVDARAGESLIFVVGMPRSGSTLVEQILASHPYARGGGERNDLPILTTQLASDLNEPYPSCIRPLDRQAIGDLGGKYLARVSGLFDGRLRLVDKNLFNYLEIGLLSIIFPAAKIIHCRRNALDSCVSCYCMNLRCQYAHDLRTIGLVYRQYERLMSYWHSVLPGRILDVQYEEMVNEPETQIRRLLAHCELPWHSGCLSPHETKRPINTASATQVNSPINSRSVGRWKYYEKHLGPLIDALSG